MTKHLTNHGCPIPVLDKPNGRAIFAKPICNSYEQAVALLKTRNLGPGDIAVVRYYLSNTNTAWDDPTGLPVRMVMGVGGANAQADDDIYIFNDSRIDGGSYVTADDVEAMLVEFLSAYATKDDIKAINAVLKADQAWKELVNNSFEENTNDHENFSRDIDELRKKLDNINIPDVDLSDYYTKKEVDELFDSIEIPDVSNLVSNDVLKTELDKKADVEDVEELTSKLDTKANAEDVYTREEIDTELSKKVEENDVAEAIAEAIEEISNDFVSNDELQSAVEAALSASDTIQNAVNDAINAADIPGQVAEAIEEMDIVTSSKFDASINDITSKLDTKAEAEDVYTKDEVYTKEEVEKLINDVVPNVDLSNYYTKEEVDALIPDVTEYVTNEALTTEVQNQIESSEVIKELQTKVETLDHLDGGEEEEWVLE